MEILDKITKISLPIADFFQGVYLSENVPSNVYPIPPTMTAKGKTIHGEYALAAAIIYGNIVVLLLDWKT